MEIHSGAKIHNLLRVVVQIYEKSCRNRLFLSYWIFIPHLVAFLVIIFFTYKMFSCYRKRQKLNNHLIEYIKSVQDIQKPLELLYEPLNEISVNTRLDDAQKDKIRVAIWRINTMQNTIKNLQNIENDIDWQKNIEELKKNESHSSAKNRNDAVIESEESNHSVFKTINESDQSFLEKVFSIVRENYDDTSFNVDLLSQKMGMSRSSFYNKIKAISGQAPADFIRQYRMERAKEFLKLKQYTIAEVAYKTGFSDVKYFRDMFSKKYNKSPGQYAKSN